ncbi:FAD-binding oxidoreductase [Roseomonas elaeocarpi]|uniref:FAD-dependent oxidoreductase n=1 Tax=Roseomonas elaeocarpi TaxID=907779 RepID=A0ABV6JSF9_9PROT
MPDHPLREDYLSWGRVRRLAQRVIRPGFRDEAVQLLPRLAAEAPVLPFGQGRSYGDSCLNGGGVLVDTAGLDRFLRFDREAGVIEAEAGVTLAQILLLLGRAAEPGRSWFLPVTPGTKFVTVGGAIANDVHGKNHHSAGCFGNHVLWLDLLRSDGTVLRCSPTENAELFAATVGGLGLTGLVLAAAIQLKPVPSLWLEAEDIRYDTLREFHQLSAESLAEWDYTVAWVDCLARGPALGRGIFSRARHVSRAEPAPPPVMQPKLRVPVDLPGFVLNGATIGAFNGFYWRRAKRPSTPRITAYEPVFYPLDAIGNWNRIYGARGFFQYQCVVPPEAAETAIPALLEAIAAARQGSFLAVLKTLGERRSPGMLSFPMPGVTLALDFPNRGTATRDLLDRLDAVTAAAGGRVYPAKDGRVSARDFRRGYPEWRRFAAQVDPRFSSNFWRRVAGPAGTDA